MTRSGEPLVSVIIPVYNVLPYLREALDSVIVQTYRNLEIIIVDDGSTDGSGAVCDEYLSDSRVQVIHQENRGLGGARNTGLDSMTGEYVAFLDSDDAFHPDMIQKMKDAICRHDADMAICDFDTYETEGRMEGTEPKQKAPRTGDEKVFATGRETFIAQLNGVFSIAVWNKFYRKKLWETIRFPERFVFEDLCAVPQVLERCGRAVKIPCALVKYRVRKGSITNTKTVKHLRDLIVADRFFVNSLKKLQPELPLERIQTIHKRTFNSLLLQWEELRKQKESPKELKMLKKEIQAYGEEEVSEPGIRMKAKKFIFRFCPFCMSSALACYKLWKQLKGRT